VLPVLDDGAPSSEPAQEPADRGARRRLVGVVATTVVLLLGALGWRVFGPEGRPGRPPGSGTLVPYEGLGAWVDAYDWTNELGGASPSVDVTDIDAMAAAGVQTLFLQTSHRRSASTVMEPERLDELIDRAHRHHMHVVAWYLPTFVDLEVDLARLEAAAALEVDGLAVDIESVEVADVAERNRRVLELSQRLRAAEPERVLGAITLSSVHVQVVNPAFWLDYPYDQLADVYDVLLPMAYWSLRVGDLKDGERYVGENIDRIRAAIDDPDFPIHAVGGIASEVTPGDVTGMLRAIQARNVIGGSLYDWATSNPQQWELLQPLRSLRPGTD
jgi:hypothetical protein